MAELVRENLITVRREKYRSSVYYLMRPENHPAPQKVHSDCQEPQIACQEANFGCLNNFKKQEIKKIPPLPPIEQQNPKSVPIADAPAAGGVSSSAQDFESIWDMYPKKEAKGFARMAWNKLLRSGQLPSLQEIASSIRNFASSENWQREQGRFVPQMGNWLRGQRWLDPLSAAVQREQKRQQSFHQAVQAQEQQERENYRTQAERLRPEFEAFAACFAESFHQPRAFGAWMSLHPQNLAPRASDVPSDNTLGIFDFMEQFKIRRKTVQGGRREACSGKSPLFSPLLQHGSAFAHLFSGGKELPMAV